MLAQYDTSLEPSWHKRIPRIDFDSFWGSKMFQQSIQKPNNFQTSLETLFSAHEDPKGTKMSIQNAPQIKLFLERIKTWESCSRQHAVSVFKVISTPKAHVLWIHFDYLSRCCPGTFVFDKKIENNEKSWLQFGSPNRSNNITKLNQNSSFKKDRFWAP